MQTADENIWGQNNAFEESEGSCLQRERVWPWMELESQQRKGLKGLCYVLDVDAVQKSEQST